MSSVRRFGRRLGQFVGAGRGERELAREVDAHLSLLEQEYSRRGLPPDEARRAAIILVIGAFACWVPARRAVRVEPMVALRHE